MQKRAAVMRAFQATLLAGTAILAVGGGSLAQTVSGPSTENLLKADNDGANWILPAHNYSANRQVEESEIGPQNVDKMKVAWTFKLPGNDPVETAPIVWGGTVYVTSGHDDVFALDAKSGEVKWQYRPNAQQQVGFPRNRGVAIYEGMVFIGMIDGHIAALDAKTGKEIWNRQAVEDPKTGYYSMAPVPYKGKILIGESNGDWGGIGNVSAFDPKTGDRVWLSQSIPKPGEHGNETWSGDSWKRGGGAVWNGMAIDPDNDTLYLTLGNPTPNFLGSVRQGKNLYTDSLVALDISGPAPKMKLYYQFIAHDTHDFDPAMPPVLFTGTVNGKPIKLAAAGDKAGNFWILNAENGELISKTPVSYQFNQDSQPQVDGANYACPSWNGGGRIQRRRLRSGDQHIFRAEQQSMRQMERSQACRVHRRPVLPRWLGTNVGWTKFRMVQRDQCFNRRVKLAKPSRSSG